jgi:hypothetical protein
MKRIALLCCLLAACAACTNSENPPPVAAVDTAPEPAQQAPASPVAPAVAPDAASSPIYSRLPDPSLQFDFELKLKSDKQSTTARGKVRRGLALEYSGLSVAELWPRVDAAFERAGYVASGGRSVSQSGGAKQTYAKAGQPEMTVSVPAPRDDMTGPAVLWLGWDI